MNLDEKKYWLGFSHFPGIGPLRLKLLREFFGSAKEAWQASREELIKIGLGEKLTEKFVSFRVKFSFDEHIEYLEKNTIRFLITEDKNYPKLLKQISDAPFGLYVRGNSDFIWDDIPAIAVVGTRMMTAYGREITKKITQGLVDAGIIIVSGMAYGIDTVAHQTTVDGGGKTIAVLGCGVDIIHPVSNTGLYWKIINDSGRVISEFPPGMMASKGLFPARNRIISGLSQGVLVTEGAQDSGALITARYAAEQGREVFAVPGPITSSLSKGPTILLKQGAKLVTEAEDILEELKINLKTQRSNLKTTTQNSKLNLTNDEMKIIELLDRENLHFDELVVRTNLAADKLAGILTMMEMKKFIKNLGGGEYGISD